MISTRLSHPPLIWHLIPFHWKCYTPEIHHIAILKFIGKNSNSIQISIRICTTRYRGMWVARFGGFRRCSIFSGNCYTLPSKMSSRFRDRDDIFVAHTKLYIYIYMSLQHVFAYMHTNSSMAINEDRIIDCHRTLLYEKKKIWSMEK